MALKRVEVTRLPGAAGWLGQRWSWRVERTNGVGVGGWAVTKWGAMRAMKRVAAAEPTSYYSQTEQIEADE